MAVVLDTTAQANATSVGITTAGSDQFLFVFVAVPAGVNITGCTVDGDAATALFGTYSDGATTGGKAFYKKGLAAGAHTVAVTVSSGTPYIGVISCRGVEQSGSFDPSTSYVAAVSDGDPSTVSPTLPASGMIVSGATAYNTKSGVSLSYTGGTLDRASGGTPVYASVGHKGTAGSTWAGGGGSTVSQVALALTPSVVGTSVSLTPAAETDSARPLGYTFPTRVRLYNGLPTAGAADGTLVTSLNPIKGETLIVGSGGDVETAPIRCAVRCDPGFSRAGVFPIGLRGPTAWQWALSSDGVTWLDWGETLYLPGPLGATNTVWYAKARVFADEDTDPDRTLADLSVVFRIFGDAS